MDIVFRPLVVRDYALAEQFKRATVEDVMHDAGLFDVWFPAERPYRLALKKAQAFDPASCAFLEVDGVPVGGVHMIVRANGDGHFSNIYVLPEWRGRGLGERLEAYAVAFFQKHGATWASLKTNPRQVKVMAFYERLGWAYAGESEDGFVFMGKMIGAGR